MICPHVRFVVAIEVYLAEEIVLAHEPGGLGRHGGVDCKGSLEAKRSLTTRGIVHGIELCLKYKSSQSSTQKYTQVII